MLRSIFFIMMMIFSSSLVAADQGKVGPPQTSLKEIGDLKKAPAKCASKEACLNDHNCLCWCSQICGWRKKQVDDRPYYVENDPYGKFCYCKKWDYEHYVANCIEGKGIKEPPGAE